MDENSKDQPIHPIDNFRHWYDQRAVGNRFKTVPLQCSIVIASVHNLVDSIGNYPSTIHYPASVHDTIVQQTISDNYGISKSYSADSRCNQEIVPVDPHDLSQTIFKALQHCPIKNNYQNSNRSAIETCLSDMFIEDTITVVKQVPTPVVESRNSTSSTAYNHSFSSSSSQDVIKTSANSKFGLKRPFPSDNSKNSQSTSDDDQYVDSTSSTSNAFLSAKSQFIRDVIYYCTNSFFAFILFNS